MISPSMGGGNQYYQQKQYITQPAYNTRVRPANIGGMPATASQGQIYYRGGGQWTFRHNRTQYSNLEPRRSSYGDLSSSGGSGNFVGDCGGGFRYSSNEDLFHSQVQLAGGVTTPQGSNIFLLCPKPKRKEDTFDIKAATEQLIDRTQELHGSVRNPLSFTQPSHTSITRFGEWAI